MKKTNQILVKVDDQLLELIKNSEGSSLADKTRNLVMQALNVQAKFTYQSIEGE